MKFRKGNMWDAMIWISDVYYSQLQFHYWGRKFPELYENTAHCHKWFQKYLLMVNESNILLRKFQKSLALSQKSVIIIISLCKLIGQFVNNVVNQHKEVKN